MPEVLIASDASYVHEEVEASLAAADVSFRHLRLGAEVLPSIEAEGEPDLLVLDLQIGNMGGMATSMAIRLEEAAGRLLPTPIIMLLDRDADVFLARRSRADAWFVKPVNPIQLRACAERLLQEYETKADETPEQLAHELLDDLHGGAEYDASEAAPGDDTGEAVV